MSVKRTWSHCHMCPDDVWLPTEEMTYLKKAITLEGKAIRIVCQEHKQALVRMLRAAKRGG